MNAQDNADTDVHHKDGNHAQDNNAIIKNKEMNKNEQKR